MGSFHQHALCSQGPVSTTNNSILLFPGLAWKPGYRHVKLSPGLFYVHSHHL